MNKTSNPTSWGDINDSHSTESHFGMIKKLEEHQHKESRVYPTLADGVTVTCGTASTWTLGSIVEVIPASTITSDFDVHFVSLENISANSVYELIIYYGDSDTFAGSCRFTKNAVQDGTQNVKIMTPVIPANSKVRAKLASSSGAADTATISLFYHKY